MAKLSPQLNAWYHDAREDQLFEVVAIDEQEASIDIQYYDGDIGEIDFETWQQMVLLPAQPPEDWRSSYSLDDTESDSEDPAFSHNWEDSINNLDSEVFAGYEDF